VAAALLAALYTFSFVFAQATPKPHELPVGVTGADAARAQTAIRRSSGSTYRVHRYADEAGARQALRDRDAYAVLVVGGATPRLLTAPAAGRSVAMLVEQQLPTAAGLPKMPAPQVVQVRPLSTSDPNDNAINLLLLPLVIFGVMVPVLITVVAPAVPVRTRLVVVAGFAVLAGLATTLVIHVWLGALPGSFAALAGIGALLVFAVTAPTSAFIGLLGPAGAGLGVLAFLIFGNVASGATVADELLPGLWRVAGPWLPPGSAAQALRNVAYFGGVDILRPLLVLAAYAIVALGVALAVGDRRPAPQGDPSGPTPDSSAPAQAEAA
jgi:hypothetical protein